MDPPQLRWLIEDWVSAYLLNNGDADGASKIARRCFLEDPRSRSLKTFVAWTVEQGLPQFSDDELLRFAELYIGFAAYDAVYTAFCEDPAGTDEARVRRRAKLAMDIFRAFTTLPELSMAQRRLIGKGIRTNGIVLETGMRIQGVHERYSWIARDWRNFRVRQGKKARGKMITE
jgi:hypothetical protein